MPLISRGASAADARWIAAIDATTPERKRRIIITARYGSGADGRECSVVLLPPPFRLRGVAGLGGIGGGGFFAGYVREQIHAVELCLGGRFGSGGGERGWVDVELDHRTVVHFARGDFTLPLHHERHADAAFPCLRLEAAQRSVAARRLHGWA